MSLLAHTIVHFVKLDRVTEGFSGHDKHSPMQRTATSPRYGRSLHTTYLCTVPGYSLDRRASSSATGERYLLWLYAGIRPKNLLI